jgi:hypothetical protein
MLFFYRYARRTTYQTGSNLIVEMITDSTALIFIFLPQTRYRMDMMSFFYPSACNLAFLSINLVQFKVLAIKFTVCAPCSILLRILLSPIRKKNRKDVFPNKPSNFLLHQPILLQTKPETLSSPVLRPNVKRPKLPSQMLMSPVVACCSDMRWSRTGGCLR